MSTLNERHCPCPANGHHCHHAGQPDENPQVAWQDVLVEAIVHVCLEDMTDTVAFNIHVGKTVLIGKQSVVRALQALIAPSRVKDDLNGIILFALGNALFVFSSRTISLSSELARGFRANPHTFSSPCVRAGSSASNGKPNLYQDELRISFTESQ